MIVADRVGIPVEKITVIKGDTDQVARGSGTYGSKSTQIGGAAAAQASEDVVERAKRLAAEELEANPRTWCSTSRRAAFHVTGGPEPALSWSDLAGRLQSKGLLQELSAEADFTASQPTFPVRSARRGRRGRHRDRRGCAAADCSCRRCRSDHQSARRRRPGSRRRRSRHRPSPVRRADLRPGRQSAELEPRHL